MGEHQKAARATGNGIGRTARLVPARKDTGHAAAGRQAAILARFRVHRITISRLALKIRRITEISDVR